MPNIIVLAGGTSDERTVSLRSGSAVVRALQAAGHSVQTLDPADGLTDKISLLQAADAIFPALHGLGGEDGVLQSFFEANAISYVGSNATSSTLCFNKAVYTDVLKTHGITVPQTQLVDYAQYQQSDLARLPYVLKPNDGGSSIDTFIVRDVAGANHDAIRAAFEMHETLLLQELIEGTEITVAVLGDRSLPVIEIIPPTDQEFDYENKYNGATQELCPPVNVSKAHQEAAGQLAAQIHTLTGCRDMSRTDIMISSDGELYVLETNTIPGLTDQSLLPKAAAQAGLTMQDLCNELIISAIARQTETETT